MPVLLHIDLLQRKTISALTTFYEAIYPFEMLFHAEGAESEFDSLHQELRLRIAQELGRTNGIPLDEFLKKLFGRMESVAKDTLEGSYPNLFEKFDEALRGKVKEICCATCTTPKQESLVPLTVAHGKNGEAAPVAMLVCDGSERDHQVVAQSGICIKPLREMFEAAVVATRQYYTAYGTLSQKVQLPKAYLRTVPLPRKPHSFPVDYFVGGAVDFKQSTKAGWAEVELKIWVDEFDWKTYLAAPYVMFHECVAHIFHNVYPSANDRKTSTPSDEFAEGWMDFVAYMVMEEAIKGRGPASQVRSKLLFPEKQLDIGASFHKARTNPDLYPSEVKIQIGRKTPSPKAEARKRKKGIEAASKMLAFLKTLTETDDLGREAFLRMSFDLNMLHKESTYFRTFVAQVNSYLPSPDQLWNSEEERVTKESVMHLEPFPELIWKYLKDNDIQAFLHHTNAMPQKESLFNIHFSIDN